MPNRLLHEQSPYLLQHAHNPVDWYPWGEEAFERARAEDKPLIVSIGYAACHWCHVMERESFEDDETAAYMNEHFVCIKVDREEHPDVDALYMDAVQAISGSGGWPLNAFVTPDRIPFYGGTYFPPRPHFNRPSWMQIMQRMAGIWTEQRGEVTAQSAQMQEYLQKVSKAAAGAASVPSGAQCRTMAEALLKMADKEWGGFGAAPKFPGTMAITFLLEYYHYSGDEAAIEHALLSLDKMIAGGIYDHLGGGFARYSTDREWLAPHFEKMLYDNALLISTLCDAVQMLSAAAEPVAGNGNRSAVYTTVIRETIAFVNRELRDGETGAFYSALDADSEGEEGKFYTWTWDEWSEAMGEDPLPAHFFGVLPEGNWEHTNILHEAESVARVRAAFNVSEADAKASIAAAKQTLWAVREGRIRPLTDDKSLLSWNALMNAALTKAGTVLDDDVYLAQAQAHMEWMLGAFRKEEKLYHVWKKGEARITAKLDDYAYLADALIRLGIAAGRHEWIVTAAELCGEVVRDFGDSGSPFCYLSSAAQTDIPVRKADVYDGATPSANAVLAGVLQSLGMLMERSDWSARAGEMIGRMTGTAARYTYSFAYWAILAQRELAGPKTAVVAGPTSPQLYQALRRAAPPHALIIHTANVAEILPLTADKKSVQDSLIFVCTGTACMAPVATPQDALRLL